MKFERISSEEFKRLMKATKRFGDLRQSQLLTKECIDMLECLDRSYDDPTVGLEEISEMYAELGTKTDGEFALLCSSISSIILDVNNSIQVVEIEVKE